MEKILLSKNIPSPQGDFLVVMCRTLVGILTGPFTLNDLSLAPRTKSAQTINQKETFKLSNKIRNDSENPLKKTSLSSRILGSAMDSQHTSQLYSFQSFYSILSEVTLGLKIVTKIQFENDKKQKGLNFN